MDRTEPFKEDIYKLLQNPTRENIIKIILNGSGELDNLDYKENWVQEQKIAEIVIGMANIGGGAIIFGVKENSDHTFDSIGLKKLEKKEDIHSKIYNYLPSEVKFDIFSYDFTDESYNKIDGKLFQILVVNSNDKELPYVWRKDTNIAEEGCIFYRRGTKTEKANMYEIKGMLDKRINAILLEESKLQLEEHLNQLKLLFKHKYSSNSSILFGGIFNRFQDDENSATISKYESYEEFIANMISKKKKKIEKILDLS